MSAMAVNMMRRPSSAARIITNLTFYALPCIALKAQMRVLTSIQVLQR